MPFQTKCGKLVFTHKKSTPALSYSRSRHESLWCIAHCSGDHCLLHWTAWWWRCPRRMHYFRCYLRSVHFQQFDHLPPFAVRTWQGLHSDYSDYPAWNTLIVIIYYYCYCYRSYKTWRENVTYCISTFYSYYCISQSSILSDSTDGAGDRERERGRGRENTNHPCSRTKNMECAPIWYSPFACCCRFSHPFRNTSTQVLSLIYRSAGQYFEI